MIVFVVIELEGNSQVVDGYILRGVFADRGDAHRRVEDLATKRRPREWFEIEECELT